MKKATIPSVSITGLVIIILLALSGNAVAQQTDPWTEYMTPGDVHNLLKEYTGKFTLEITMWMSEEKAPEIVKVKSNHKMVLGGRFLEMVQTDKMMGMEYEAVTTIGYNNSNRKFVLSTLTNMGTGMIFLEGGWNETNQVANLTGSMTDPTDKKSIAVRQKITFVDSNTLLVENFDKKEGGPEKKSIQYKYTREKD